MGMVYGYFDESNEGKELSRVASFCGAIGSEEDWTSLDSAWRKVLDDPKWPNRPKRFHATNCVNGTDDFSGWSYTNRLSIWSELMQILIDSDLLAVGVALLQNSYRDLPEKVRQAFGPSHFFMMEHAIQTSISESQIHWPGESLGLVFDRLSAETAKHAHIRFLDYSGEPRWSAWKSFRTDSSDDLTMLQAADMMAYSSFRFHMENGYPNQLEPDFKVTPLILRLVDKMKSQGVLWNYDGLMKIYEAGPCAFRE